MDKELHITNSQIVFSFRRNPEIRKRIFEFEDSLKDEFRIPFRSVAVPDEIDPNIPRFESQSINGYSRIQVSQTRITLATKYSEQFMLDYKQVEEYILNKCNKISELAKSEDMDFVAYVIELSVYMEESRINTFIKENTGIIAIKEDCRDFSMLYSTVYKSDFYLNVNCSKFTEQVLQLNKETNTFRPTEKLKTGISIVLDINTKPFFERNKKFEKDLYQNINKEAFELINRKSVITFLKGEI